MHPITALGPDHRLLPRRRSMAIRFLTITMGLAVFGAPSIAAAQDAKDPAPHDHPPRRRPWFGGLGYTSIAPFFGEPSSPKNGLQAPEVLGASYDVGKSSLLVGGGGGAVLFGHLWLGGKGHGLLTEPFSNARGEAALTGGGGGLELGYVLPTDRKMLIIPFFGVGGFGYRVAVTNHTSQPMTILQAVNVAPGESKSFTAGFATLDVGIRFQRLLFSGNGGFTAGFEFGLLRSLSTSPWHSGPYEFTHEKGATLDGVYLRLNVGGGGFSFR